MVLEAVVIILRSPGVRHLTIFTWPTALTSPTRLLEALAPSRAPMARSVPASIPPSSKKFRLRQQDSNRSTANLKAVSSTSLLSHEVATITAPSTGSQVQSRLKRLGSSQTMLRAGIQVASFYIRKDTTWAPTWEVMCRERAT